MVPGLLERQLQWRAERWLRLDSRRLLFSRSSRRVLDQLSAESPFREPPQVQSHPPEQLQGFPFGQDRFYPLNL